MMLSVEFCALLEERERENIHVMILEKLPSIADRGQTDRVINVANRDPDPNH